MCSFLFKKKCKIYDQYQVSSPFLVLEKYCVRPQGGRPITVTAQQSLDTTMLKVTAVAVCVAAAEAFAPAGGFMPVTGRQTARACTINDLIVTSRPSWFILRYVNLSLSLYKHTSYVCTYMYTCMHHHVCF